MSKYHTTKHQATTTQNFLLLFACHLAFPVRKRSCCWLQNGPFPTRENSMHFPSLCSPLSLSWGLSFPKAFPLCMHTHYESGEAKSRFRKKPSEWSPNLYHKGVTILVTDKAECSFLFDNSTWSDATSLRECLVVVTLPINLVRKREKRLLESWPILVLV